MFQRKGLVRVALPRTFEPADADLTMDVRIERLIDTALTEAAEDYETTETDDSVELDASSAYLPTNIS